MRLRWKFFCALLLFSLIPLAAITIISRFGTSRMGAAISQDVKQEFTRLAHGILQLTAENSAAILEQSKKTVEFALARLAQEAEMVLSEEPPGSIKVYFAADFDDASRAPPGSGPRPGYSRRSADGRLTDNFVSFEHPVVLVAPGVSPVAVAEDIDRLSLLADTFAEIAEKVGHTLHWAYVSTGTGVHVSFPGHGGYPDGYDPRARAWYVDAADEIRWSLPIVDATTGHLVLTASKAIRYPDGSRAGVAAMDVLISEVLRIEALSAWWTDAMRSFLVTPVLNPEHQNTDLLIVAQKDYHSNAGSWEGSIDPERLTSDDPGRMTQLLNELNSGRSGFLDMPYKRVDSIWAFATFAQKWHFVVVVPKSVLDKLPEKNIHVVEKYTSEELALTAAAALTVIVLAIIAALAGSRSFTHPMHLLAAAAGRLSRGDFGARVDAKTGDERDQVIQAFNDMVPTLEDHVRLRESLGLATEIQQNLLPRDDPSIPDMDIAGASLYCDETGGDYYDFLEIARDPLGSAAVVVGDVSGHGVQAALLMASARAALRLRASLPGSLSQIVADVNRQFTHDVAGTGAFMTLFYMVVDSTRQAARWVRAGHDPAILYDPQTGSFEELGGRGVSLGVDEDFIFEENERKGIKKGGLIFIGTDGIWETARADGRFFGKEALRALLRTHSQRSAREIVNAINQALEAYRQDLKPADDITMVVIKFL